MLFIIYSKINPKTEVAEPTNVSSNNNKQEIPEIGETITIPVHAKEEDKQVASVETFNEIKIENAYLAEDDIQIEI